MGELSVVVEDVRPEGAPPIISVLWDGVVRGSWVKNHSCGFVCPSRVREHGGGVAAPRIF